MNKFITIFAFITAVTLSACTVSDSEARSVLKKAGYTNIEIGGYDMFACSDEDTFASQFTATNANGMKIHGTVCCGWLKSCTIRY